MTMEVSNASVAFNDIAARLFGPDAFMSENMLDPDVYRFVSQLCALTWNRWRKSFEGCRRRVNNAQVKVDDLYLGKHQPLSDHE